ncbi:uncharacterized protein LOC121856852 [Homarus americanus]|uniref:uncharacterized protein LOC121856852 n=1 Tax=Homarus americanus TaxID=6706 RepID=UPI001C4850C4|nr:uncharacterized protein LOC121856852 [Homarus americanus]
MGICDISGINIVCDTDIRQSVREKVEVTANESDKDSVIDKVKVDTILSADIFDDDLFNESVIRTTQAMEEALTDIDESNVLSSVTEERCVKVSEILFENFQEHHESEKSALQSLSGVKVIGAGQKNSLEEQCKPNDNFSDIVDGKASNRPFKNVTDTIYKSHSATYHDNKQKPCQSIKNSNNEGKIITFGDQSRSNTSHIIKNHSISGGESSCTPILAKTCSSLINNSHRQSRKSFRLESNPQTCSRTKTDKISLVLNVKSSTDSESKSVQSSKNHKLNKGSVNSSVHFTLSSLPSSSPLLRNSECNNESARLTNKGQTMRGLLLRSHSTSNAKISGGDVSSAVQRSKSSIAGDFSREFEDDDEFFESLVSHLPEDGEELIKNTHFQQGTTGCIPKCRKVAAARCKPKFSFKDSSLQSFRDNQEDNKEVVQEKMLQVVSGTTLETPNLSESFVGGRRNQRSFIHSKQAMTSCPQNSKPCNNKLPSVNMERSLDSQLEEDEQGDSKACHHVSTKTTRRASEILDDDLFEDDVLSIIDEVECE